MTESKGKAFDCFKCDHNSAKAEHEIMCEVLLSGARGIIYVGDDDVMRCNQYGEKADDAGKNMMLEANNEKSVR